MLLTVLLMKIAILPYQNYAPEDQKKINHQRLGPYTCQPATVIRRLVRRLGCQTNVFSVVPGNNYHRRI